MQKRGNNQIMQDFRLLQSRQLLAMALTLFLLLFLVLIYKRTDIFGEFSKNNIIALQIILIGVFIGFSAINWRCPSCNKYLGGDINKRICKKCGIRLQ
jgi:Na+/citrate or Na+/malate symporter